jgi:glycerate kinase
MIACGARLTGGFDLVSDWLELDRRVAEADLIITGEGRFDDTSLQGKGPGGLVRMALARGKRALVVAGSIQLSRPVAGLELLPITPEGMPRTEALPATARLLAEAAWRIAR